MDTQNFQDLQEISKKLLGSYVAKAGEDLRRNKNKEFLKRDDEAYHASGGNRHTGPNPELAAKAREDAKTYSDKASRRARGLAMAGKKIANESTLEEYVNNVVKSIMEDIQTPERAEQQEKRIKSADRAAARLSWRDRSRRIGRLRQLQRIDKQEKEDPNTTWGVSEPHHIRGHDESKPRRSRKRKIQEDVFDSNQSSAASRQNVKKATKVLGAKSPHTKELAKLHTKMKNSRFVYGIADNEVNRREFGDENYGKKPTLTPMKGKSFSGYDAIGGTSDRSVNTGIIKKAAAAIRKSRGGKVVSEGAVEKIKRILGITPKKENPNDFEVIQPYRGGAKVTQRKIKAKEEPKPGLLDLLYPG